MLETILFFSPESRMVFHYFNIYVVSCWYTHKGYLESSNHLRSHVIIEKVKVNKNQSINDLFLLCGEAVISIHRPQSMDGIEILLFVV